MNRKLTISTLKATIYIYRKKMWLPLNNYQKEFTGNRPMFGTFNINKK